MEEKKEEQLRIWQQYREPLVHVSATFYNAQKKITNTTHAVVHWTMGKETDTFYVRNEPGKHAEVIVIERLSEILTDRPGAKMTVQIYQNFSPCNNCCSELIEFKKDKSVDLTIIFGGLYNINRNSCVHGKPVCPHFTNYPVNEGVSNNNKAGLRNLSDAGIQARTFTPDNWNFLYKYLDEPDGPVPAEPMERTEDPRMQADYEDIVPPDAVDEVAGLLAGAGIN